MKTISELYAQYEPKRITGKRWNSAGSACISGLERVLRAPIKSAD